MYLLIFQICLFLFHFLGLNIYFREKKLKMYKLLYPKEYQALQSLKQNEGKYILVYPDVLMNVICRSCYTAFGIDKHLKEAFRTILRKTVENHKTLDFQALLRTMVCSRHNLASGQFKRGGRLPH